MSAVPKRETRGRLIRQGNSTALTLPRDVLAAAGLDRGDSVTITADPAAGTLTVRKADDEHARAMAAGRAFAARYRRTLAALAE